MSERSLAALPDHYRAWTWQGDTEPRSLALRDIARPTLPPATVLVRNAAIGLNPVDWKVLEGQLVQWQPGHVPGVDGAGTVVAVADDVSPQWLGQRVAYHQSLSHAGSFAEYTPLAARALLRVPAALDWTAAAALPCPALTAWLALEKIPAAAGRTLLLNGAGGAVGHYLVQLARARGFSVTAVGHPRHWERLRALGAQACIAGSAAHACAAALARVAGHFFAAVDAVGQAEALALVPTLRANGHLVCIQGRVPAWPTPPFGRALSLHEVALGALHREGDAQDWSALTAAGEQLLAALAGGQLQPQALEVQSFLELPTLLGRLRERTFSGKAVIRL